ncbi:hypothetical protein JZ751_013643 [Albula glossodonta]|uniref:Histone deacetylase complex subunit SAP130 C-terminal domain-containing protein n=1 Tax=Albula glossodonta TaxID=121402 RepID=A0A8T2P498_9TELE|nr:hypothetical protein JZ751_013643 [Albula glossodonta]
MSSQQFPRSGVPASGLGQAQIPGAPTTMVSGTQSNIAAASEEGCREGDHGPRDHAPSGGGTMPFRDEKQETVVVRPYPQPLTLPQHLIQPGTPVTSALKTPMPSRLIAPAPASSQGHLTVPPKVPGHVTVTMESSMPQTSAIPVATISGQQGHSNNLHHHLMATNVQIIRSSTPALQIGSSPAPHTFTSHLPRGAAAAAVMSSSKGPTVLRPATGAGQPTVQHVIHQPSQSRPVVTTSAAALPAVVAPVSATRAQSPVITTAATHTAEMVHGRPGLTIHPPPATISIQRPPSSRDAATRITLPSHPAIGAQKPQQPHTMTQKPIFSTVTPVAAATVAPILATNTVPSPTTTGSVPHTQMTASNISNIVTMTMPSHSSHATAVTTSTIPVGKPQKWYLSPSHTRHPESNQTTQERGAISSPSPATAPPPTLSPWRPGVTTGKPSQDQPLTDLAREKQPVPVQFQYFLPTYPSSPYPLTHTYTPITSSVSTIRQYPVTPQAPSSAMPAQTSVGVASAVHLNSMQLMTVDRITQISTQGIQPAAMAAQGIQSAPIGAQGLHTSAPIGTQGIQPAPINTQQPQTEAKASVVLPDGSTLVANPINTFSGTQPVTTVVQTHPQGSSTGAPSLVSSPRPSILRKKPANEGSTVRKSLIPAQPGEATSPRLDSTIRSASGSPRPAG